MREFKFFKENDKKNPYQTLVMAMIKHCERNNIPLFDFTERVYGDTIKYINYHHYTGEHFVTVYYQVHKDSGDNYFHAFNLFVDDFYRQINN